MLHLSDIFSPRTISQAAPSLHIASLAAPLIALLASLELEPAKPSNPGRENTLDLLQLSRDIERLQKIAAVANVALSQIAALSPGQGIIAPAQRKRRRTKAEMQASVAPVPNIQPRSDVFDADDRGHRNLVKEVIEANSWQALMDLDKACKKLAAGSVPADRTFITSCLNQMAFNGA